MVRRAVARHATKSVDLTRIKESQVSVDHLQFAVVLKIACVICIRTVTNRCMSE